MRSFLLGAVLLVACSSDPPGMLTLSPDTTTVAVGASTFVQAFLEDGSPNPAPITADWSVDPSGIIMLTPTNNIQKVTGLAPGNVVVTATADDQTAQIGFTVTSM